MGFKFTRLHWGEGNMWRGHGESCLVGKGVGCSENQKVPSSNRTRGSAGLRDTTSLRGSLWPLGRKYKTQWLKKCKSLIRRGVDNIRDILQYCAILESSLCICLALARFFFERKKLFLFYHPQNELITYFCKPFTEWRKFFV